MLQREPRSHLQALLALRLGCRLGALCPEAAQEVHGVNQATAAVLELQISELAQLLALRQRRWTDNYWQ